MHRVAYRLIAAIALLCGSIGAGAACDASSRIPGAGARYFLLAEGDSITFGTAATDGKGSYVPRACVPKASGIETLDTAVAGAVMGSERDPPGTNSLWGRMAPDNAILAAKKGRRIALLTILIGRNDLTGYGGGADAYADNLAAYVASMRRAGWNRVMVGTLLPSTWDAFTPARHDLNAILTTPGWAHAHGIDAIVNFAALPEMGPDAAAADKALFADGVHPTNEGYAQMAVLYDKALKALIARRR